MSVADLADTVWEVLLGLSVSGKYRADIIDSNGKLTTPPIDPSDGRVVGYLVAYFGPGRKQAGRLGSAANKLTWSFQVTCAGGTDGRAFDVVDQVRGALTGLRISGAVLRELNDPGPMRRDDTVTPTRMYLPLSFGVTVNG